MIRPKGLLRDRSYPDPGRHEKGLLGNGRAGSRRVGENGKERKIVKGVGLDSCDGSDIPGSSGGRTGRQCTHTGGSRGPFVTVGDPKCGVYIGHRESRFFFGIGPSPGHFQSWEGCRGDTRSGPWVPERGPGGVGRGTGSGKDEVFTRGGGVSPFSSIGLSSTTPDCTGSRPSVGPVGPVSPFFFFSSPKIARYVRKRFWVPTRRRVGTDKGKRAGGSVTLRHPRHPGSRERGQRRRPSTHGGTDGGVVAP